MVEGSGACLTWIGLRVRMGAGPGGAGPLQWLLVPNKIEH